MLYLDFEGSHAKGVRQIGYLITEDNKITKAEEKNDDDAVKCLFNLQKNEFRYIAAHNSFVEKNFLKKYFPYHLNQKTKRVREYIWLDSLNIYRSLYPNLKNYDLKFLVNTFIDSNILKAETENRCKNNEDKFHHPLFDAICVYLLIERLKSRINLDQFLQ